MKNFRIFSPETPEESSLEKRNRQLARDVASESIVLLKNDGVLPLQEKQVALYGAGARMTIRGGAGSGDMRERYSVNIEDGLLEAGFSITSQEWLSNFTNDYDQKFEERRVLIEDKVKDYTMENVLEMFEVIASVPLKYPIGSKITDSELPKNTKTAIYVVSRQAGEGHDRRLEPGDFLLDDVEIYNINKLSNHVEQLIIIINCGSMIDLTPLDNIKNIGAILFIGQGGTEGGNSLADILLGKTTPSAKLVDTWAHKYEDFPSHDTFSYMNGDLENENYYEGIYVGYRYFESFNITPRYEFGFGLSYTQFSHEIVSQKLNGTKLSLKVNVKNIGETYSGKETIQLYISKPGKIFESEKISLISFGKTKELKPSETTELTLTFDMKDAALFNDSSSMWLLEKGIYELYLGNSSKNTKIVSQLRLARNVELEKVENTQSMEHPFKELSIGTPKESTDYSGTIHDINPEDFTFIKHQYGPYQPKPTAKVSEILDKLSIEDLVKLCVGGGQFEKYYNVTPGSVGSTTMDLIGKGVPNINMSDGPAGLNVLTETVITEDGTQLYLNKIPDSNNWGFIKDTAEYSIGTPDSGRPVYQFMTAWPAVVNQAQTWNPDLIEKVGLAIGEEMLSIGISLWLAPAINIHRNPLCGRNFEYYSEDPYLTGVMAAAVIRGVQSFDGIGVTLKHYCCNNQEDNRNNVSSNVSERALREIYLKAFRHVVQTEQPKTIMSSYNKVNGTHTANNYDLLTKVLRNEFGFDGVVMTDWHASGEGKASYELCQASGNDLIMPGFDAIKDALLNGLKTGIIPESAIKSSATSILNLIFSTVVSEGF